MLREQIHTLELKSAARLGSKAVGSATRAAFGCSEDFFLSLPIFVLDGELGREISGVQ